MPPKPGEPGPEEKILIQRWMNVAMAYLEGEPKFGGGSTKVLAEILVIIDAEGQLVISNPMKAALSKFASDTKSMEFANKTDSLIYMARVKTKLDLIKELKRRYLRANTQEERDNLADALGILGVREDSILHQVEFPKKPKPRGRPRRPKKISPKKGAMKNLQESSPSNKLPKAPKKNSGSQGNGTAKRGGPALLPLQDIGLSNYHLPLQDIGFSNYHLSFLEDPFEGFAQNLFRFNF